MRCIAVERTGKLLGAGHLSECPPPPASPDWWSPWYLWVTFLIDEELHLQVIYLAPLKRWTLTHKAIFTFLQPFHNLGLPLQNKFQEKFNDLVLLSELEDWPPCRVIELLKNVMKGSHSKRQERTIPWSFAFSTCPKIETCSFAS